MGDAYLFFGCRKSTSDFIYQDEMAKHRAGKTVSDVYIAFSRDTAKKVYVQDLIREKKDLIIETLIEKEGYFYICGNTKMG